MGSDKALLPVGDVPMVRIVADVLRAAGIERVYVAGSMSRRAGLVAGCEVIDDVAEGRGPLGGVAAALGMADTVVICSCDVPGIEAVDVQALLGALASHPSADVAVARSVGRVHPLVSVWRSRTTRPVVLDAIAEGPASVMSVLDRLASVEVEFEASHLVNLNTPGELAEFVQQHAGRAER